MLVFRAPIRLARRLASSPARPHRTSAGSTRTWQQINRRCYASEGSGHGAHKPGSDLPWAITSAVVTIPAMVYLLQPSPDSGHGHGHDAGEPHGDESREEQDEEAAQAGESSDKPAPDREPGDIVPDLRRASRKGGENAGKEEDEKGGEEKAEDQSEDSGSDGEDQQDTPDTSDDEQPKNVAHETDSGGNVEGVQFKGATSGGTRDGEQGDTRKHIPDAKGGNKKRIESHYGKRQGVAGDDNLEPDENGRTKDKPATAKPPGDMTTISGKQEGLSNTDTKHSTDLVNDPDKSKKGEGVPETAKSKGTISPFRPQAENRPGSDEGDETTR